MADYWIWTRKINMSLEHLVVPKSKEVFLKGRLEDCVKRTKNEPGKISQ